MNRDAVLWTGVLTGPTVWLISFLANFALAPWICVWNSKLSLYVVSLGALAIAAAAGLLSWREWVLLPADSSRARSMALGGMGLSALSLLVIVGQIIVEASLGACE
jgi:hypothetical protein